MVITFNTADEPHKLVTLYDMVSVPAATGVTTPPPFTVASELLLLLQVPPEVLLVNTRGAPIQTAEEPEIALREGATAFTVMFLVT